MIHTITFTVPGIPAGQGSMRPFKHARTGKARMKAENRKALLAWRAAIKLFASQQWGGRRPTENAVAVHADFKFARPESHYRTGKYAGQLKATAPKRMKAKKNDLDKLLRALLDALTGLVYMDDGQVDTLSATKRYDNAPGMDVFITI